MVIPNKYVIVVVLFAVAVAVALGSKIPPWYLSDQQFLTFQTFLATVNWVGYLNYPPEEKGVFWLRGSESQQ